jgi:hypothetical protein
MEVWSIKVAYSRLNDQTQDISIELSTRKEALEASYN